MRPTPFLSKGILGRSIDELKRATHIVANLEAIRGPQGPYVLHTFNDPASVEECKVMSDAEISGFSQSHLDWHPASPGNPPPANSASSSTAEAPEPPAGYARFHGVISTELPKSRPEIQRTGYAAFRTPDRKRTLFSRGLWDIDPYTYLALRLKSDGRSYFINVQTESIVPTDLHQHRLFAKRPGEWETVLIKWNDFVRTNHGMPIEPQTELLRQKVNSVGVGLTDRVPGPFELCIERIWTTNDASEAEVDNRPEGASFAVGGLKKRSGENVAWNARGGKK
ncbi:probable complex I intermediate-associated protein CIA30 precursor, mitochondrial [Cephalotrichum gorgonifer]|uniref:Probable complex I intermediate-associated protein CIA30, mitochondrial n=1 Tax=Cephalotrichum gorgonifer TaxID=2041049 RepID=A0AAE8MTC4_9PEZI|nr:probable complex I intermediate-associated protein CIA30 precursor, mitochondrial [Cephalotrichum gorgonifer]